MNRSLSRILTGSLILLAACTQSEQITSPSRDLEVREARAVAASYSPTNLGTIAGYDETIGFAVNDAGTVAIQATYLPAAGGRIAKWYMKTGSVIHLLDSGGIRALSGGPTVHVIGFRSTGVRWTYSTATGFSPGVETPGYGYAVNDAGDVVAVGAAAAEIWNSDGTTEAIATPDPSAYSYVEPRDINSSRDAAISYFGGSGRPDRGYIRIADGVMIELQPLSNHRSTYVRGVSDRINGKIYAGGTSDDDNGKFNAVRWTIDLATHAITRTVVGPSSTNSLAMADDGTLAGNFEGTSGFVMTLDDVITTLKTPKGSTNGRVWQISGNGRYISGDAKFGSYRKAILWTAQ